MRKLKSSAFALGLLVGGFAIGQAFSSNDIVKLSGSALGDSARLADDIAGAYASVVVRANGAPQISQVTGETLVRLEHLQARQNAEIIKLLTAIRDKK